MKRFLIHVSTYWCGMDYMYPQNFGNHEYASWSEMSYEEGINELYDFVEGNRVIGCIYDW